jgi:hypothetical protein
LVLKGVHLWYEGSKKIQYLPTNHVIIIVHAFNFKYWGYLVNLGWNIGYTTKTWKLKIDLTILASEV